MHQRFLSFFALRQTGQYHLFLKTHFKFTQDKWNHSHLHFSKSHAIEVLSDDYSILISCQEIDYSILNSEPKKSRKWSFERAKFNHLSIALPVVGKQNWDSHSMMLDHIPIQ